MWSILPFYRRRHYPDPRLSYEAVDLAGIMHYALTPKRFARLYPGAALHAVPEPDNAVDPNAIAVFLPGRRKLGYLPRVLAARIRPHIGQAGIQVLVYKTVAHTPEGPFRIGVMVPLPQESPDAKLTIRPHGTLKRMDAYYYLYTDARLREEQLRMLEQFTGSQVLAGPSDILLETSSGQFHPFHFKHRFPVEGCPLSQEELERRINDDLGITLPVSIAAIERHFEELLDSLADDDHQLRQSAERLKADIVSLQEENQQLKDSLEITRLNQPAVSSGNRDWHRLFDCLFPGIEFLQHSLHMLCTYRQPAAALEKLQQLQAGTLRPDKKLQTLKDAWYEVKFSTGDSARQPSGRMYYRTGHGQMPAAVLLSIKEKQEKDLNYLKTQ